MLTGRLSKTGHRESTFGERAYKGQDGVGVFLPPLLVVPERRFEIHVGDGVPSEEHKIAVYAALLVDSSERIPQRVAGLAGDNCDLQQAGISALGSPK